MLNTIFSKFKIIFQHIFAQINILVTDSLENFYDITTFLRYISEIINWFVYANFTLPVSELGICYLW